MQRIESKPIIIISLILISMLTMGNLSFAQGQEQDHIALKGITWTHSTLSVLIVPQTSQSWWDPAYLNASLHAVDQWNNAILTFSANYSDFAYISGLQMNPTVSQSMQPSYDISITWTEMFSNQSGELGQSSSEYRGYHIINNTIILATKDPSGYVLSEADMQNVVLHELGHSLGLGHCDNSGDVMYPLLALKQNGLALSTLDLYGVSQVFSWINNSAAGRPPSSLISLPSNIPYQYLPIPLQDVPPPPPRNPLEFIALLVQLLFQSPELLVAFVAVVFTAIILVAIAIRRR